MLKQVEKRRLVGRFRSRKKKINIGIGISVLKSEVNFQYILPDQRFGNYQQTKAKMSSTFNVCLSNIYWNLCNDGLRIMVVTFFFLAWPVKIKGYTSNLIYYQKSSKIFKLQNIWRFFSITNQ